VTVIHPADRRVSKKLLGGKNAIFVWGELMDPRFIAGLLGGPRPYAPAHVSGFERRPHGDFFTLASRAGAVSPGVVLLGLSASDVKKLDAFEQCGVAMRRTTAPVAIGQINREAFIYLKIK
jgi:hypothetical protein